MNRRAGVSMSTTLVAIASFAFGAGLEISPYENTSLAIGLMALGGFLLLTALVFTVATWPPVKERLPFIGHRSQSQFRVEPCVEGLWVYLRVTNEGASDRFVARVEELGDKDPYHVPWHDPEVTDGKRNKNKECFLVTGDSAIVNIAALQRRQTSPPHKLFRFYSVDEWSGGLWRGADGADSDFGFRISVLSEHSGHDTGSYRMRISDDGHIQFERLAQG